MVALATELRARRGWTGLLLAALASTAAADEMIYVKDRRRTPEQVEAVVEKLRLGTVNDVNVASGYPRLMRTDEIPGMKPGAFITVIGFCRERADAQEVVDALADQISLAIRKVEQEWDHACPNAPPQPPLDDYEVRLRRQLRKTPKSPDALLAYARYLQQSGRLEEALAQVEKLIDVDPANNAGLELRAVIRLFIDDREKKK